MAYNLHTTWKQALGLVLGLGLLGTAQAKEATPDPTKMSLSSREVRATGFGPWSFGDKESAFTQDKDTDCQKFEAISNETESLWQCPAQRQEGNVWVDQPVSLTFEKGILQGIYFDFYKKAPASPEEEVRMAAPAIAFLQALCPDKSLQLAMSKELQLPEESTTQDLEKLMKRLYNNKDSFLEKNFIELSCPAKAPQLMLYAHQARFVHKPAQAELASAPPAKVQPAAAPAATPAAAAKPTAAEPPTAAAPPAAVPAPGKAVLSSRDMHPKGFGSWHFGIGPEAFQKNADCKKRQESSSDSTSTWVCSVPIQTGELTVKQAVRFTFGEDKLQEISLAVNIPRSSSSAVWVRMAAPMFAFLQDTCPDQPLQGQTSEKLRFSGTPTVQEAAKLIRHLKNQKTGYIQVSCPAASPVLLLYAHSAMLSHTPAKATPAAPPVAQPLVAAAPAAAVEGGKPAAATPPAVATGPTPPSAVVPPAAPSPVAAALAAAPVSATPAAPASGEKPAKKPEAPAAVAAAPAAPPVAGAPPTGAETPAAAGSSTAAAPSSGATAAAPAVVPPGGDTPAPADAPPAPFALSAFAGFESFTLGMSHAEVWKALEQLPTDADCEDVLNKHAVMCRAFPVMDGQFPVRFSLDTTPQRVLQTVTVLVGPRTEFMRSEDQAQQYTEQLLAYLQQHAGTVVMIEPVQGVVEKRLPATVAHIFSSSLSPEGQETITTTASFAPQQYVDEALKAGPVAGFVTRVPVGPDGPTLYQVRLVLGTPLKSTSPPKPVSVRSTVHASADLTAR